jgi:hypothetical protein
MGSTRNEQQLIFGGVTENEFVSDKLAKCKKLSHICSRSWGFLMHKTIQLYKKVDTMTWLRAGQCRVRIPTGTRNWPFIKMFRLTLAPSRFVFKVYRHPYRRKFDRTVKLTIQIHPVPAELQEWVNLYLNVPYTFRACTRTNLSLFTFMVTKGAYNLLSSWENIKFSGLNVLHVATYYCSILLLIMAVASCWK